MTRSNIWSWQQKLRPVKFRPFFDYRYYCWLPAGETEEDFEDTMDVVQVQYDSAFTFIQSVLEHRKAAAMDDQIQRVVRDRFDRLLKACSVYCDNSVQPRYWKNT